MHTVWKAENFLPLFTKQSGSATLHLRLTESKMVDGYTYLTQFTSFLVKHAMMINTQISKGEYNQDSTFSKTSSDRFLRLHQWVDALEIISEKDNMKGYSAILPKRRRITRCAVPTGSRVGRERKDSGRWLSTCCNCCR